jgi:hypothetical protein
MNESGWWTRKARPDGVNEMMFWLSKDSAFFLPEALLPVESISCLLECQPLVLVMHGQSHAAA